MRASGFRPLILDQYGGTSGCVLRGFQKRVPRRVSELAYLAHISIRAYRHVPAS